MSRILPKLRSDIDIMPSPVKGRPGLLLRDPFGYTTAIFVIPPPWIAVLQCLDGTQTELDAQALLTRLTGGQIVPSENIRELVDVLSEGGFLETEAFYALRREKQDAFRGASHRESSHAGTAYPDSESEIEALFDERLARAETSSAPVGLAAPHVSPEGGFDSYGAAYDIALDSDSDEPLTFVILGTSHYGQPERFGLTRKPFLTPLGEVEVAGDLHDFLVEAGGDAVLEEDFCHAHEHSIEFQVLFLQYRLRRPFRILPVLCGPFVDSLSRARPPERLDENRRMFEALGELADRKPDLRWVLGVDMAHVGSRYGDRRAVRAGEGPMVEVEAKDRERLDRIARGDAEGFFELVHPEGDELNWCGYSPLYTFLRSAVPALGLEGELRHYEQWNIDEASVVSFAAMHFAKRVSL